MKMRPVSGTTFILVCFLLSTMFFGEAIAQTNHTGGRFSYVYIQGDKATPFYVKMDGKMLPRYGKDHCIISELKPGPVNIEILFSQNEFPAEQFTIDVPENGARGFLLDRQGSGFALYDLQDKSYTMPQK